MKTTLLSALVNAAILIGALPGGSPSAQSISMNAVASGNNHGPYVEVTAYGAKGDGQTDDTAAIQAAIYAACKPAVEGGGGVVFFPPASGVAYILTQPEGNGPVLDIQPCSTTGVTFEGAASAGGGVQQFSRSPMTRLLVKNRGSGGWGPVFAITRHNNLVTFRNIQISGFNQAIQVNTAVGVVFENVSLTVSNSAQPSIEQWKPNHLYMTGALVTPVPGNEHIYRCNVGGTSGSTLPSFRTETASATTDGSLSWREAGTYTFDNTPLAIYSSFWIWGEQMSLVAPIAGSPRESAKRYRVGQIISLSPSNGHQYRAIHAGITSTNQTQFPTESAATVLDGSVLWQEAGATSFHSIVFATINTLDVAALVRFDRVTAAGGGFLFDQRIAPYGTTGDYEFNTVDMESATDAYLTIASTGVTNGTPVRLVDLQFQNSQSFDCKNHPFLELDQRGILLENVSLKNSYSCGDLVSAPPGAQIVNFKVEQNEAFPRIPFDTTGHSMPVVSENYNGWDIITDTSDQNRLRTDFVNGLGIGTGADGTPIRMAPAGSRNATLGLDPTGIYLNGGPGGGYDAQIHSAGPSAIGFDVAEAEPPSNFHAVTGPPGCGNLPQRTYYYVVSTLASDRGVRSGPSSEVVVSVPDHGCVNLSWTPSPGNHVSGYIYVRAICSTCATSGNGIQYIVNDENTGNTTDTGAASAGDTNMSYNRTLATAAVVDLNGFTLASGKHFNQARNNGDVAGQVSSGGLETAQHIFITPFHADPVCNLTPTENPGDLKWWISVSRVGFTLHLSSPSALTFDYLCVGNPN